MKASDLVEKYKREVSSPIPASSSDCGNGTPFVLGQSEWVRILLIRGGHKANDSIDVELTLPDRTSEKDSPPSEDLDQAQLVEMISAVIEHMHYLRRLNQAGFQLYVSEEDFLWTATLDITTEPNEHLFDVLLPP